MSTTQTVTSEQTLMSALYKLTNAGGSIIQIRTREPMRAVLALRRNLTGSNAPYSEWIGPSGWRNFTKENFTDFRRAGKAADFFEALIQPISDLRDHNSAVSAAPDALHYYAFVNPQRYIQGNPMALDLIMEYAAVLPSSNVCLVFITDDAPIQGVTMGDVLHADFPTPTAEELSSQLIMLVEEALKDGTSYPQGSEVTEEDYMRIAHMGLGMTHSEFETYAAIALVEGSAAKAPAVTVDRLMAGIAAGKTAVVKQSEILELSQPCDISEVGGMERLKDWLTARANAYSPEAQAFGIEAPKGCALVGVPGSGKSLVAKACASIFQVPLVRLDFARVFSKYVGDSEQRVRSALLMVESMAPCVLFVDEIDKGLGGAGGGGDSGTSSRVLGTFLTWLQECKAPVFTIVTANRVTGLPPELLRRGRFDQIFSVAMPGEAARRDVLAIHLRKRNRKIADFQEGEIAEFLRASQGYVPAEIESAVKDALVMAFNDPGADELQMSHLISALSELVPMSKSHADQIASIVAWAEANATPVEYTTDKPKQGVAAAPTPAQGSRLRARVSRPGQTK